MTILHCHIPYYSYVISTLSFLVAFAILIVGSKQLQKMTANKRIDFTYQVYMDFFSFLNDKENKDLKGWLFGEQVILPNNYTRLGDLFEKFEAVYSLMKQKSINREVFYDLISYYVEKASSSTNNPNFEHYVQYIRDEELKKGVVVETGDIFIGFQHLLNLIRKISKEREGKDKSLV